MYCLHNATLLVTNAEVNEGQGTSRVGDFGPTAPKRWTAEALNYWTHGLPKLRERQSGQFRAVDRNQLRCSGII